MSLVNDIKNRIKREDKKNVADIGAAAQVKEEEKVEDVLVEGKCKLLENISIRMLASEIDLKEKKWFNPDVEFIIKKGTEVKPIKETNAGTLIDILMVEFGSIRISVPSNILSKGQKKSKLKQ